MRENNTNREFYGTIDGLRTFACMGIVFMHVLANSNYNNLKGAIFTKIIPSFTQFVFLFMIISGFSMCCGYYQRIINGEISLESFYKKRIKKIWPFFAFLCILDFILSPSVNSLKEVFANLTLCFGLLPNPNISVIGVGWFLGLIVVFYMMFPFFVFILSNKKRVWLVFCSLVIFNVICSEYFNISRTNFIYSSIFFLAGGMIYIYKDVLKKFSREYSKFLFAGLLILYVGYFVIDTKVIILLALFSLTLIWVISKNGGLLENKFTRFFSGISMEIYLCHMIIYRFIEKIGLLHVCKVDAISYFVVSIGTIVGAVIFSIVTNKIIKQMENLIFRFIQKKKDNFEVLKM